MPVIKVWCLPKLSQSKLKQLFLAIVKAVESVPELELNGIRAMTVLFPPDSMKFGLGSEIVIEVTGLFVKPKRTKNVRKRLARSLGEAVEGFFPDAIVECFVYSFRRSSGFWRSEIV